MTKIIAPFPPLAPSKEKALFQNALFGLKRSEERQTLFADLKAKAIVAAQPFLPAFRTTILALEAKNRELKEKYHLQAAEDKIKEATQRAVQLQGSITAFENQLAEIQNNENGALVKRTGVSGAKAALAQQIAKQKYQLEATQYFLKTPARGIDDWDTTYLWSGDEKNVFKALEDAADKAKQPIYNAISNIFVTANYTRGAPLVITNASGVPMRGESAEVKKLYQLMDSYTDQQQLLFIQEFNKKNPL